MKTQHKMPHIFNSISELHRALGLAKPLHPLISLVDYGSIDLNNASELLKGMVLNFYKIAYHPDLKGQIKYGQQYYDFEEGGLSFVSPNQLLGGPEAQADYSGYTLLIHPDFIRSHPLATKIKRYGFFSYSVHEALYLSQKEKGMISMCFDSIAYELDTNIDGFSQDVMLSHLEVLLNYSNRFYNRQFITRKAASHNVLDQVESVLAGYFSGEESLINGLPTVQQLADRLNLSARYLSDLLRALTGQSAQQHIHNKLIEQAKDLLSTSSLSVAEVAYKLGFEHPQSFNKFFKKKTNSAPVEFRQSFH